MKVHDLQPAPGSNKAKRRVGRGIGGKGGKTAGRGTKGQKARGQSPPPSKAARCRCTCGSRSSRASTTRSASSTRASTSTPSRPAGLDEVSPETLHAKGLVGKESLVKVLGRGELTRAVTVKAHGFSEVRRGSHHRRGRYGGTPAPALGRPSPARQGQPVHQPLIRRPPGPHRRPAGAAVLSTLRNVFKVPDLRNKILFTLLMMALYRFGSHIPVPGHRRRRVKELAGAGRERRRARRSCRPSPAVPSPSSPCSRSGSCRTSRRRSSCRSWRW